MKELAISNDLAQQLRAQGVDLGGSTTTEVTELSKDFFGLVAGGQAIDWGSFYQVYDQVIIAKQYQ